jgi:hypothetical protein
MVVKFLVAAARSSCSRQRLVGSSQHRKGSHLPSGSKQIFQQTKIVISKTAKNLFLAVNLRKGAVEGISGYGVCAKISSLILSAAHQREGGGGASRHLDECIKEVSIIKQ